MAKRIDVTLLKRLAKADPPEKEAEIVDSETTGLRLKRFPTGALRFYAQLARGKRETIAHAQGSGRRAIRRGGEALHAVDARDVLDRAKPEVSMTWVRRECQRLQGELLNGTDHAAARQADKAIPTFAAFLADIYGPWLKANPEHRDAEGTLSRLARNFGEFNNDRLDTMTPDRLTIWKAKRLKSCKPETANRDLTALKSAFAAFASPEFKHGFRNPLQGYKLIKVDTSKRVVRHFNNAELDALINAAEERDEKKRRERNSANRWREERGYETLPSLQGKFPDCLTVAIIVAADTGMRRGEQFALSWGHVDIKNGMLNIKGETTKTYQSRKIPLTPRALSVLRRWHLQGEKKGHVFGGIRDLKKAFNALIKRAGIERETAEGRVSWHSLRHCYGTRLGQAGVDPETMRRMLGHANIRTTQRYLHTDEERMRAAAEALAGS